MKEYVIINAVPSYKEAPVSTDILKENTSQVLQAIGSKQAKKNYIILDQREKEVMSKLVLEAKNYPDINLEIVAVDGSFGFVYKNASAALKVIKGEKPIPSSREENEGVYTVEMLLAPEHKNLYIDGSVNRKGKYALPKRTTPREILKACGTKGKFKGMYLGYPMGMLLGEGSLDDEIELSADYIGIFDEGDCMLAQLKNIAEGYAKETCGRCVFGHEGVTQINMILSDISQKKGKSGDIALLLDLCGHMKTQVLCGVDAVLASTVISALENFRGEIEDHITKRTCRVAVCSKFITYHILADKCTGCKVCIDACSDDAILGKKKFIHVIDQEECTQCGACLEACEEGAIVKAGAVKPKCPPKPIPCRV